MPGKYGSTFGSLVGELVICEKPDNRRGRRRFHGLRGWKFVVATSFHGVGRWTMVVVCVERAVAFWSVVAASWKSRQDGCTIDAAGWESLPLRWAPVPARAGWKPLLRQRDDDQSDRRDIADRISRNNRAVDWTRSVRTLSGRYSYAERAGRVERGGRQKTQVVAVLIAARLREKVTGRRQVRPLSIPA